MRLFLTGGTGFLGSNIIRVAREQYDAEIFTTVNTWRSESPIDFAYGVIDMGNRASVLNAVRAFQPDVIVHSAILNDLPLMYRDRKLAWRSYVEATHHLTDAANEVGCKIIMVSTDWIFDGTQAVADESTPPNPVNYYGVLKVASERVIAERAQNGAVARVAGVNGIHWLRRDEEQTQNAGFGHFTTAVLSGLRRDGTFTVWMGDDINVRATPSLASESAAQIMRLATRDLQGIFHCTGGESIGRMEFAQLVAEAFGYDPSVVREGAAPPQPELAGIRIPRDTSLSAAWTASQLNRPLLDARALVRNYRQQVETGAI
ncbi:MAG: sugar nucleotide-binding protein [Anaerolineae bacterium]|nr:sugar nucleotide-binding protein [Anaerolineae bacterium]